MPELFPSLCDDFNPRSPYGERPKARKKPHTAVLFQSTLPLRGATMVSTSLWSAEVFQSTLPLRGATLAILQHCRNGIISIHAPLTGSDGGDPGGISGVGDFNPRSPYGERPAVRPITGGNNPFQSTLPLRGATVKLVSNSNITTFQSTLPLRGATGVIVPGHFQSPISIHAPLTGSDRLGTRPKCSREKFQSTLPLRGATGTLPPPGPLREISIHAPLTGSDEIIAS